MIFIGIGSNLPSDAGATPLETCEWALGEIACMPALQLVGASSWYRTAPVPASDQADYVNGIAMLSGTVAAETLLAELQRIERKSGRVRVKDEPNAARVLDLDIVDLNRLVRDGPDPVLPHPRAHLRGFVLHPLADLAPDWVHPSLNRPIGQLIAELPPHRVTRWDCSRLSSR